MYRVLQQEGRVNFSWLDLNISKELKVQLHLGISYHLLNNEEKTLGKKTN